MKIKSLDDLITLEYQNNFVKKENNFKKVMNTLYSNRVKLVGESRNNNNDVSNTKKLSVDFNKTFERFETYEIKKQAKLEVLRKLKIASELIEIKDKPQISERSISITKSKNKSLNFNEREEKLYIKKRIENKIKLQSKYKKDDIIFLENKKVSPEDIEAKINHFKFLERVKMNNINKLRLEMDEKHKKEYTFRPNNSSRKVNIKNLVNRLFERSKSNSKNYNIKK